MEEGPQSKENYEGKNPSNRTILTILWVHKTLPQCTVRPTYPSNLSYEGEQVVTNILALILFVPLKVAERLRNPNRIACKPLESWRAQIAIALPLSSFPCFFGFPCFFPCKDFLCFFEHFPFFPRDFRGSAQRKNPLVFWVVFLAFSRVCLNLWFGKPMVCVRVVFHENEGNPKNDDNDKDNSGSYKQGSECCKSGNHENHDNDENHENPGCKPRVPQTTGLEIPNFPKKQGKEDQGSGRVS